MSLQKWALFLRRKFPLPTKRDVANRSSNAFIECLRRKGVCIGEDCEFIRPATQFVDPSNPQLNTIGDKAKIPLETAMLAHGLEYSILRELHPMSFSMRATQGVFQGKKTSWSSVKFRQLVIIVKKEQSLT
jgi:hypothetical protein